MFFDQNPLIRKLKHPVQNVELFMRKENENDIFSSMSELSKCITVFYLPHYNMINVYISL